MSLHGLGPNQLTHLAGILEYNYEVEISAKLSHLAAAVCFSSSNYTNIQAYINYISFMFQAFIKLQFLSSNMPAKGKGGCGKGKKSAKPKAVLPFLSSDDEHDDRVPEELV